MFSIIYTCVTFVCNLNLMNQTNDNVFGYHKQN